MTEVMTLMPLTPRPTPPKRRRCTCPTCRVGSVAVRDELIGIVAVSYTKAELRLIVRAQRAAMLPRDDRT